MRVAFFTAGSIGLGHVAKDLAIRRALKRVGFTGEYQSWHPKLAFGVSLPEDLHQVPIDMHQLRHPIHAQETELFQSLVAYQPDVLLIELFWAPLIRVLPHLSSDLWLLLRKAPAAWYVGPSFATFDRGDYDRVFLHEPAPCPIAHEVIDPICLVNPEECQPRGALRRRLGISDETHLTVVMQAGLRGEAAQLRPSARDGYVLTSDAFRAEALFPAAEWIGDADEVYAGAGYGAFWESKWLGWYDRTHFTPFERPIDDQAWRIRACAGVVPKENGADQLARAIVAGG